MIKLLLILVLSTIGYAQSSITLNAPSPSGVPQVNAQLVGNRGNATFYYWVVARYLRGQGSGITPAQIAIAPNTLDSSNYVKVLWNPTPGALSYDVLRTTTPTLPSPCVCSLATGQTGFTYNNQNNTLSSYTYSPVAPANGTWSLNNSLFVLPRFLMNRQMDMYLGPYTVATLPTPDPNQPYRFQIVTDGNGVTDCTVGGGATLVICMDNGGAWISAATGGGGSGTVTSVSFTGGLISVANPTTTPALTVAGTSGGVPYFSASSTWASSAALTANAITLGGGAGTAPASLGSLGTTTTLLHGNAAGAPTFGAVGLTTDVAGTLPVANGGTGLTAGTSGGVLAYTASGTLASSGVLTANLPVIGGGAGVAPSVGTRSGNTTAFVTTTGAQTSGRCVTIDASGNHVADSAGCGAGSGTVTVVGAGSLTSTALVTGGGTTTIQTPAATATMDSSGNVATPGTLSTGVGGSTAGAVQITQGTTQSPGTTAITVQAPTSVTSYIHTLPGTASTGIPHYTNSSNVITESISNIVNADITNGTIDLTAKVTGILPAANGGTGSSTGQLFTSISNVTTTSTSAATMIGTVVGSTTLAANTFRAGSVMYINVEGTVTAAGVPSLQFDLFIGGSSRITMSMSPLTGVTTQGFRITCTVTTRTVGASGTQVGSCDFTDSFQLGGAAVTSAWTLDTTGTLAIDAQSTWDNATGSPSITTSSVNAKLY